MKHPIRSFALGALATLSLLAAGGLIMVVTGAYNVAASEPHTPLGTWALHTAFTRSVERRANGIEPPAFTPAMVAVGAREYEEMCEHCHGGVGERREEWAEGMNPKPPALARAAKDWSAPQVFWLVKHGAKMTGMPAFGDTHDDKTIWAIAAFVKAMPTMSEKRYDGYRDEADDGDEHHHGHHHGGGE